MALANLASGVPRSSNSSHRARIRRAWSSGSSRKSSSAATASRSC